MRCRPMLSTLLPHLELPYREARGTPRGHRQHHTEKGQKGILPPFLKILDKYTAFQTLNTPCIL